jgi:hypothetical protein
LPFFSGQSESFSNLSALLFAPNFHYKPAKSSQQYMAEFWVALKFPLPD